MDDDRLSGKVRVLKAMAHPARLAMIESLAHGERCVCDLQRLVGSDMSTVSKHLALMKAAGVVADRKEGQWVYYRLRVPCILRFFDCLDAVLEEAESHPAGVCSPHEKIAKRKEMT